VCHAPRDSPDIANGVHVTPGTAAGGPGSEFCVRDNSEDEVAGNSTMLRTRTKAGERILQGSSALVLLAALLVGSCSADHPLAPSDPTAVATPPDTSTAPDPPDTSDSLAAPDPPDPSDSLPQPTTPVTYTGLPFGPSGLWTLNRLNWGPSPFTGSQNYIRADTLILQINAARDHGQRLVLAMTGGGSTELTTNGQFDMTKWKSMMDTYRTTAIQDAVAAGVADGTIIGNVLIDEPETKRWGTVVTKALVDEMAVYVKGIFPTLPVGVNHGPPAVKKWRTTERYKVLDFVRYQYNWYITFGDVVAWRESVLAQAKLDGVTPALSINVLDGGVKDMDGDWLCVDAGQAGIGTYWPNCRMTPDEVKTWGTALAPYGCFFSLWQYDNDYMSNPANQEAFKAIADLVASIPPRSCKRA
jgi:hypothetical protein